MVNQFLISETRRTDSFVLASLMKCYMDETVDPCEEFYDYACGRWKEYHPIPKDRGGYDTFEILREDLSANLINLFEEPPSTEDSESTIAVKLLYNSCMNTGACLKSSKYNFVFYNNKDFCSDIIQARQEKPLIELLEHFGGWPVLKGESWNGANFSWIETLTVLRQFNNDILISIWVGPDGKDSDDYIVQVYI